MANRNSIFNIDYDGILFSFCLLFDRLNCMRYGNEFPRKTNTIKAFIAKSNDSDTVSFQIDF